MTQERRAGRATLLVCPFMARRQARSRRGPPLLALVVTLALGTALGWVLFGRDGGDARPGGAAAGATGPSAPGARPKIRLTNASYPKLGLAFGRPSAWTAAQQSGVVKLSASDATVSLAVSISGAPGRDKEVRRYEQGELLRLFKPARVIGRQRGRIGRLPVLSTEIAGTTKRRRPIRILSTAATTRFRTYSVQVFSTPSPPAARLAEVQAMLNSFRFAKPT